MEVVRVQNDQVEGLVTVATRVLHRELVARKRPAHELVIGPPVPAVASSRLRIEIQNDAVANFDLFSQIARHRYLSQVNDAVLDHGHLRSVGIEDERIRRNEKARGLARDVELDGDIGSGRQ